MHLFNSLLTWFVKHRIEQIESFTRHPVETQTDVFQYLIQKGVNTEFGKEHKFKKIKSIKDFQEAVPIRDYESIKVYIERTMKGEENVLWPSKISWFAKSSGTTSDKSKFIPITKEGLDDCHYKGGKDLIAVYCNNYEDTKLFTGKGLIMGGSNQINQLNENSRYGDISAVMMQNMPFLASLIRTPELSIALMDDWEEKIQLIAETTSKQNVTHLVGVPTWTIVLINRLFEMHKIDNLLDLWPNLELYIHGGVSFSPYREQFKQLIPSKDMHYMETYNASEGFIAIQNDPNENDLLLMLDYGIFYEFVPMSELKNEKPKAYTLDQVEKDVNYALVLSSNCGLWRYLIGDTVKFTNLNPFKIKITGRTKHFINAFGEEVMVDNTDEALAKTCKQTSSNVSDYTVAPVYFSEGSNGSHEWLIEFKKIPENKDEFVRILDKHLQTVNSDYEAKRFKDMALLLPKVHFLSEGTFNDWLKSKGKLGGQNKVPRLSNNRELIDEILKFIQQTSA
ncbi:MAG: hypothetical protein EA412_10640 [Chitinophagaceae bacterium]|nr:MAG: hypothetical protein EA412_10640 [Chitinophagaceae bacterium]